MEEVGASAVVLGGTGASVVWGSATGIAPQRAARRERAQIMANDFIAIDG